MKDWEIALNKFMKKWENNKDVTGALVCGSFVTGNPTKHSDIDLHIVLSDKCDYRIRGNEYIDGILIEYFINPPKQYLKYLESDYSNNRKIDSHMFSTGKILFDKNGDVKKLVTLSKKYLKKSFKKTTGVMVEINKYHLWDNCDNLEEVYMRNKSDIYFCYYNYLNELFNVYSKFLGFESISFNKIRRFLVEKKDIKKYNVSEFSDKKFVKKFIKLLDLKEPQVMLKEFKALNEYVLKQMGSLSVDGWKIRTPVEK
ncbi:MAG: nucleotidyltransferase domain-containing protein [Nanoarchaeales archaeon]|nr:nucleotidyltransferase domain-containing protein [Nanoarchaeales archaeon]